jgi:hypothetical protein
VADALSLRSAVSATAPTGTPPGPWKRRAWLLTTVGLTVTAFTATVVLAPPGSAAPVPSLAWLLFLGSSVHVASTGWLFTLPEVRGHATDHPTRYITIPIVLIGTTGLIAASTSPSALEWLLLPFVCWQFFHFQKQNLGLSALAASSYGARPLSTTERRALTGAGSAGILGLVAHPNLVQLKIGAGARALFPVAGLLFAAAVVLGLASLLRRPKVERPAGFCAMFVVALLFSLPVFAFGSPYAAVGGMTVAHGFQYLLLVGLVAAGSRRSARAFRVALLGNVALIGGALLGGASHLHGSGSAGRLLFGAYLGAVMAHFVVDGGLWRMRDAFPRALVTASLPYLVAPRPASPSSQSADRSSTEL